MGDGVRGSLWQLALGFLVFALWKARRLGRPVAEPQPVELAASELTVAVGNLLQRCLTTTEPRCAELEVAVESLNSLLSAEEELVSTPATQACQHASG